MPRPPSPPRAFAALGARQQLQVLRWLCGPEGFEGTRQLVAERFHCQVSLKELDTLYRWRVVRERLHRAAVVADEVRRALTEHPGLDLSAELLSLVSQLIFETKALEAGKVGEHAALRRLRHKDTDLNHQARRLALIEGQGRANDPAALADEVMSTEARARKLREVFEAL